MTLLEVGRRAYEVHRQSLGMVPNWDALAPHHKAAWKAATEEVERCIQRALLRGRVPEDASDSD